MPRIARDLGIAATTGWQKNFGAEIDPRNRSKTCGSARIIGIYDLNGRHKGREVLTEVHKQIDGACYTSIEFDGNEIYTTDQPVQDVKAAYVNSEGFMIMDL